VLRAIRPSESGKDVFVGTREVPCTYIRITRTGFASYCVQHRAVGRVTIGDVRVISPKQAIARAKEILSAAFLGRNLLEEEAEAARQKKAEKTVKEIVDAYLAEPEIKRQRSYKEKKAYLEKHWAPLHDYSAERIERSDIVPVLRKIASSSTSTANMAKGNLGAMFSYALMHGWLKREYLPTTNLPTWEKTRRARVFSLVEMGRLYVEAPQIQTSIRETFGAIVQLLALTGCRLNEIADLALGEVDEARQLLVLPGSRIKNGYDHLVPLVPRALEIIKAQPPSGDPNRVFPRISWNKPKKQLEKLLGFDQKWVIHDLRRTFSTGCREHLDPVPDRHLVELSLNHVQAGVAGIYDRSERLAERRQLLERWAAVVLKAAAEQAESE
jgi:integrase